MKSVKWTPQAVGLPGHSAAWTLALLGWLLAAPVRAQPSLPASAAAPHSYPHTVAPTAGSGLFVPPATGAEVPTVDAVTNVVELGDLDLVTLNTVLNGPQITRVVATD